MITTLMEDLEEEGTGAELQAVKAKNMKDIQSQIRRLLTNTFFVPILPKLEWHIIPEISWTIKFIT